MSIWRRGYAPLKEEEIKQGEHEVIIFQKKYAKEILKRFKLEECKEMNTSMNQKENICQEDRNEKIDGAYIISMIGCLMYLIATRPGILNFVAFCLDLCIVQVKCISKMQKGLLDMSKALVILASNTRELKNSS